MTRKTMSVKENSDNQGEYWLSQSRGENSKWPKKKQQTITNQGKQWQE